MTSDVIDEATVEYIIRDEKHVALALCVEKAMPVVRQRLFRKILEGVERKFSTEWIIFSPYRDQGVMKQDTPLMTLRKRSWRGYTDTDRKTGIRLSAGGKYFELAYVNLDVDFSQQHLRGREKFFVEDLRKLKSYKSASIEGVRDKGWAIIWKHMGISLTDVANPVECTKVVDQWVGMIKCMATEIDSTMNRI